MNLTIEQMETLWGRLHQKSSCIKGWISNEMGGRCWRIKNRLVEMEREKRIKEGRYWNGL